MVFWLVVGFALIFLRFARHVLHIEHLRDILGADEWFVFISNFFEVHYRHHVLVCCYATSCSVHPLAPKQRNLQRPIVKLPYLLDDTKVAVLIPIIAYCINTHTAILVRAIFVLGSCVKCISIYLVPLVLHYCDRWSPSQPY